MAGVTRLVAWSGLLLVLALAAGDIIEAIQSTPVFWPNSQLRIAAAIALVLLQSLLIVLSLAWVHTRLKAETEAIEARAELMHRSRLALAGQLSASIAHEINQPLGAILSNADAAGLMLASADPNLDEVRLIMADIRNDGLRASDVVRQVRALAQKHAPELTEIDLQDLCEDVLHLVAPIAKRRGVTILTDFDSQVPRVHGDPILLRQAMLNLLLNAMDALVDVPESQAITEWRTTSLRSGDVEIAVRDHGQGMPESQLEQLFEAFFTTKTHGLGLGLSIVRSIVEFHHGHITAENHPDGGAVFRFTIPAEHGAGVASHPAEGPV
ncbi:MAG: ATP-binding protein [Salinisphaera sp.]|uniref:sensor histidine kinase n=1 Tax=Salinisphaera sp. TaxID=1914330 RepID=UPI003C7C466B